MFETMMNQTGVDFENLCADMADDLSRLDYCVIKILELSAVTTDTQDAVYRFAQCRPEIYSCADIACDYSSRLQNALEVIKNRFIEAINDPDARQTMEV